MDRNHTCKLLFENCMDCILHDCCVFNVHGIHSPGNMLHKRIIHIASHGNKINARLEGRLYQLRMNTKNAHKSSI